MRFVRRHPAAAYFALAYALSWLAWSPLIAAVRGAIGPVPSWIHHLGSYGPLVSAFIVTALVEGRGGLRDLLSRMARWRVGLGWLLVGILSPFAVLGLAAIALRIGGAARPDWSQFARSEESPAIGLVF